MPLSDRCNKIRRMAEIIIERKEELARLRSIRCWKAIQSALTGEIPRAAHNLSFFADFMEKQGGEVYPMEELSQLYPL